MSDEETMEAIKHKSHEKKKGKLLIIPEENNVLVN